jgi:hypothetical protein
VVVLGLVGLLTALAPTADAARLGLQEVTTGLTDIVSSEGDSVSFELFLDTEGLDLQGFMVGIDIDTQGGSVSGITITHQPISGLYADLFGAPVIDTQLLTIRNDNQSGFTTSLPAGVYVLDVITITVDNYAVDFPGSGERQVTLTPTLAGETLGLGGGSCPGTAAGCGVTVESATMVPEPGTALLVGLGLLGLAAPRSRARLH